MDAENFKSYTAEEFVHDEYFREIVRESGSTNRLSQLLEELPEKRHEIETAVYLVRGLDVNMFQQPYLRKKELWNPILQAHRRQVRLLYFRYAASLLLLIGIGSTIFYFTTIKKVDGVMVVNTTPTDNAILILGNGKKVSINSKQSIVEMASDGSEIMVNDSSVISQSVSDNALNQIIIPYGKRSYVLLSDGTKVWLNSGSKLVFPTVFKGKTREVLLEGGEALFDVAKNKEKPFFVKTDAFRMKVYGTKFNVQAYLQDNEYNIVLVEGKVSMLANRGLQSQEIFLAPNQKATFSKGNGNFEITKVENTLFYTAWIDGYLTFTDEEVTNVLKRISRYYNVTIEVVLPDKVEKIYGKLDLKDDVEKVLDGLAFISKTKYEKKGDKYVFINN